MTEIRVGSPETSETSSYRANIQMQGFAAGDGRLSPRAKDPGAGANPGAGTNPEASVLSASVRSEPDLDTIMPMSGSYSHFQPSPAVRGWPGRSRGAGGGGVDSDANSSEEENDIPRSQLHLQSPRSIGFTTVEVCCFRSSVFTLYVHVWVF